jgi:hypothetical protein
VANLSYVEVLYGVVGEEHMEPLLALIDIHKTWGGQSMARLPAVVVINLIDEIKRLREQVGGFKQVPDGVE